MLNVLTYSLCALFFSVVTLCEASPLDEGSFDTISIRADEASEDERPGILHFKGHFLMHSSEWQLTSSRATVYGRLDRPDQVNLEGSPARFLVTRAQGSDGETVEATASMLEYQRSVKMLKLTGNAVLKLGDEVIRSDSIEYDIDTDRYRASGADGVLIAVPAVD